MHSVVLYDPHACPHACSRDGRRQPGQLDALLTDLGPIPDAEDADDLAFWVAALVNPVPALGVCREVRPRLLEASDGVERVDWAYRAINDSIKRMKAMPPGPFECEPPPKGARITMLTLNRPCVRLRMRAMFCSI